MLIDEQGLALSRFDFDFLQKHQNLADVIAQAIITGSGKIEPSHFLLALLKDPDSYAASKFKAKGLNAPSIIKTVENMAAHRSVGQGNAIIEYTEEITLGALSERSREMFAALEQILQETGTDRCGESHLLAALLMHLEEDICRNLLTYTGLDISEMARQIRVEITSSPGFDVFDPETGELIQESFNRRGWRVVEVAVREAEGYGFERVDSLILLLALISIEDGVTQSGIRIQGVNPLAIHENITLNLRAHRGRKKSSVPMARASFFESTRRIIEGAALEATKDASRHISESHLLRAFIKEVGGMSLNILKEMKVNLETLCHFATTLYEEVDDEAETARSSYLSFKEIEEMINQRIVGQENILAKMMPFIKRVKFGYQREGKTAGVFLFVGDPGVGKTETAKLLAEAVYGSPENLIMIEMGQMATSESRSMMIGAAPGYIGYGEGKLTNGLRDKPLSVVLFDEMEKAHPLVFDVLLRFLNEGKIDDPAGPERDGTKCIVVLTSNLPVSYSDPSATEEIIASLRRHPPFKDRPELLSRVDSVLPFCSLEEKDYREIAVRQLRRDITRLKEEKEIDLQVDDDVYDLLAERSFRRKQGARAVEREIIEQVITPMIDLLEEARPARVHVNRDGDCTVCREIT